MILVEYNGKKPKIGKNVFVAYTATMVGDVEIDDGASIWYGTVLRGDTSYIRIGKNTNIQDNCTIHTDTGGPAIIGDDVTIGHNAVIHGCRVEKRCLIGIGAVVLGKAHIKTGSVVAAGALVKSGQAVGPNHLVAGNPAVFKKTLTASDAKIIDRPVRNYLRLARENNILYHDTRHLKQLKGSTMMTSTIEKMRKDAIQIFYKALEPVEPRAAVKRNCRLTENNLHIGKTSYDLSEIDNIYVIGTGKASAPMAAAIEDILGSRITKGIVNVKYEHVAQISSVQLVEAGHPVPDENGQAGAQSILNLLTDAKEKDLVICLISGGGSALLPLPVQGLTLTDKQQTTNVLLACGATIHEINTIRKHLSRVKGGQLARAAYPAHIVSLMLSDVIGDDLDVIASGPTVPDSSTFKDCMDLFTKYDIVDRMPKAVVDHIEAGISGSIPETPKSGDPAFQKTLNLVIGSNIDAVVAAEKEAKALGYNTVILSSMIEGETKDVALVHCAMAREVLKTGNPLPSPACILSGGETTVTLKGTGLGGRNQEFALVAASDVADHENIVVLSGGTDGNDGPTDAAGAISDNTTQKRALEMKLSPNQYLENNDSYHFFEKLGDLLKTGPTNTNVMDVRIMLIVTP
jgi:hydroxypyruvate reductase